MNRDQKVLLGGSAIVVVATVVGIVVVIANVAQYVHAIMDKVMAKISFEE